MWNIQYLVLLLCEASATLVLEKAKRDEELGKLPALGWNSWNAYGCDITEDHFVDAANKMVDLGLKDAGYQYVNIDDCWGLKDRDAGSKELVSDPAKFPSGIQGLADNIHGKGLKIGIYSSAGITTCQSFPASLGNEELDASTWAKWGIDYLKYDNCGVPDDKKDSCRACVPEKDTPHVNSTCSDTSDLPPLCSPDYDYETSNSAARYSAMGKALSQVDRPILYSICNWGEANVQSWGHKYAQSWRSTNDITPEWPRILEILNENSFQLNTVDFFAHPDADMLELGNGLSPQQSRTHFALWAAMKSPLLIGTNLANISAENVDILKNKDLLAFNQDPRIGRPAMPYKWGTNPDWTFNASFPAEFWSGPMTSSSDTSKNDTLVLLFNPYEEKKVKELRFSDVPELKGLAKPADGLRVRNAWDGQDLGCYPDGFTWIVDGHDTAALVVEGPCGGYA